jgi:hypothetical protein
MNPLLYLATNCPFICGKRGNETQNRVASTGIKTSAWFWQKKEQGQRSISERKRKCIGPNRHQAYIQSRSSMLGAPIKDMAWKVDISSLPIKLALCQYTLGAPRPTALAIFKAISFTCFFSNPFNLTKNAR